MLQRVGHDLATVILEQRTGAVGIVGNPVLVNPPPGGSTSRSSGGRSQAPA
jgi:hypothetical protein